MHYIDSQRVAQLYSNRRIWFFTHGLSDNW